MPGTSCSTRTSRSSPSSAGRDFSRSADMLESDPHVDNDLTARRTGQLPRWVLAGAPLLLIVAAIGAFVALGGPGLGERRGPPAEELVTERTTLRPGVIELTVRNDGPDDVSIAQVMV